MTILFILIAINFIALMITYIHAFLDFKKIGRGESPNHGKRYMISLIPNLALSYIMYLITGFWQIGVMTFMMYLPVRYLFYNLILNTYRKKPLWYKSKSNWSDRNLPQSGFAKTSVYIIANFFTISSLINYYPNEMELFAIILFLIMSIVVGIGIVIKLIKL